MRVFLVRHVKAGDRTRWEGTDVDRPASKNGRKQAAALADRLGGEAVSALISSPSARCLQSLEPLAARLRMKIATDDRLAEGSPIEESLAALRGAPDGAVLCSHGDVIPDLIAALARRGMTITTAPDWRKATVWVLDGGGDERAGSDDELLFDTAVVEPPPPI